ncbi:hypothetical protein P3G55_20365 [Leptospira sp. 96542]|nr:hypothetical protein [Leptospira sp. 96542]
MTKSKLNLQFILFQYKNNMKLKFTPLIFIFFLTNCADKQNNDLQNIVLLQAIATQSIDYGDSLVCNGYALNFPKSTNQKVFFINTTAYLTVSANIGTKIILTSTTTPLGSFAGVFLNPVSSNGLDNCQSTRVDNASTIFTSSSTTNRMEIEFTSAGRHSIRLGAINTNPQDIQVRTE